jgi:cytochrome c-type biogenesis protein CcmE
VARKRSTARLVIAVSVAAALGIFVLYTSAFSSSTPSLRPSQLAGHDGRVSLRGRVVGPVTGDAHATGLRFRLRDVEGPASVLVLYRGTVPDQFRVGRDVIVEGRVRNGRFVSDSLMTKCPSKYAAKKQA